MNVTLEVAIVDPLLAIKVHVPKRRRGWIARPRLSEQLNGIAEAALTLVSAPPGFGKTTLLADWLSIPTADGRTVAWFSLDYRDNDPALFWAYLVTALRTATPGIGADALSILQSPQPPTEAVLSSLLNDLNTLSHDVVLVLDDYHVIDTPEVHNGMGFLLEHLPQQMHVVIAARADPALPVARLRGRGELVEIRAADLRFTPDEAAAYLGGSMGLTLTAKDVAALAGRTEGWIAALQLAALSMQGRADVTAFILDFAGDDRYIVDYLTEEVLNRQPEDVLNRQPEDVLNRQPEDVQCFLMRTSILDQLSGSLCDAECLCWRPPCRHSAAVEGGTREAEARAPAAVQLSVHRTIDDGPRSYARHRRPNIYRRPRRPAVLLLVEMPRRDPSAGCLLRR